MTPQEAKKMKESGILLMGISSVLSLIVLESLFITSKFGALTTTICDMALVGFVFIKVGQAWE